MARPKLNKNISLDDFQNYYWLKEELTAFCQEIGICRTGGKIEIAFRIEKYLKTGVIIKNPESGKKKSSSQFDWNKETLSPETIITDNYKNTRNVRNFFSKMIGSHFKFNVEFMAWMKENYGKKLNDAIEKCNEIAALKKSGAHKTTIAPQFEYNQYMRDFLEANPTLSSKDAMKCWKMKRNKPGTNRYDKDDLIFLE